MFVSLWYTYCVNEPFVFNIHMWKCSKEVGLHAASMEYARLRLPVRIRLLGLVEIFGFIFFSSLSIPQFPLSSCVTVLALVPHALHCTGDRNAKLVKGHPVKALGTTYVV